MASPLAAAASPSGEPQFITVYNLEYGNTTWQLPLQAGRDALHALTPTAAVALGAAAAAISAGPAVGVAAATSAFVGKPATNLPSASLLPDILRGVAHAGVAALQFSPQVQCDASYPSYHAPLHLWVEGGHGNHSSICSTHASAIPVILSSLPLLTDTGPVATAGANLTYWLCLACTAATYAISMIRSAACAASG